MAKFNPVAKFQSRFNKAVVMEDRKRETKKRGDYLDDYKTYQDIMRDSDEHIRTGQLSD